MTKILIAGPCVSEQSTQWVVDQAGAIAEVLGPYRHLYDWVFKTSFDKANRTEANSFRGLGMDKTLEAFVRIKKLYGCRVTTDIHEVHQAHEVAPVVDIIQIPAMLSRQTDLITAAARKGAVNIKVGQSMNVVQALSARDKASKINDGETWLTYRGTAFGNELLFDPYRLAELTSAGTTIADVTHSSIGRFGSQQVNARVAASLDVDGLFLECHPRPAVAQSDSATQIAIRFLPELLEDLTWPS